MSLTAKPAEVAAAGGAPDGAIPGKAIPGEATFREAASVDANEPDAPALDALYCDFADAGVAPLWTQRADLMPSVPAPAAVPAVWRWTDLKRLADRSAQLVPVGRGGERRAIALCNPGLRGEPYATPTLWAAIQYLGPKEVAPAHRHSQSAFRFVVEGEGVWTNVDGDAIAMRRGDLLLTASWRFHEHHNTSEQPMAWIDGLDIPLVNSLDAGFFESSSEPLMTVATPDKSHSERLWGYPGLAPACAQDQPFSPLAAYRWQHTDAALTAQLEIAGEGGLAQSEYAAVRFVNPATGGDALPTMRMEVHRYRAGMKVRHPRIVGSSVWQVLSGHATVTLGEEAHEISTGDLFVLPSWTRLAIAPEDGLDIFRFGDEPVYKALGLARTDTSGS